MDYDWKGCMWEIAKVEYSIFAVSDPCLRSFDRTDEIHGS